MIPKNIFFIWFGDYIPLFVKYNIQRYINMNKDFNVIFIYRTYNQLTEIKNKKINNIYDNIIYTAYYNLISHSYKYCSYINELKKNILVYDIESIVTLSDIVRLELLNTIGGIYVDCDVFQLKPFDQYLLSLGNFVVKVHHNNTFFSTDNFFMGSDASINNQIIMPFLNPLNLNSLVQTDFQWYLNPQYIMNRKLFYTLKFNDIKLINTDFYIEHYTRRYI